MIEEKFRGTTSRLLRGLLFLPLVLVVSCAGQQAAPTPAAPPPKATMAPVSVPAAAQPTAALSVPAAASSPAAKPTGAAAPAATAASAAIKPTGDLRVAISDFGTERYQLNVGSTPEENVMSWTMDTLIRRDPKTLELIPSLAEKWTLTSDGLTQTLNLRKGIQFQGGYGEFTAEDVKWGIEMVMRQGSTNPAAADLRDMIKQIDIVDPYTIVFRFKVPTWGFAYNLTNFFPFFTVMSKKHVDAVGEDKAATQLIGTGPWKLLEYKRGESMRFEAVENHWRQTPYFKNLTVRLVPDATSALAMVGAGEADIMELPLGMKAEAEKRGIKLMRTNVATSTYIQLGGIWPVHASTYDPTVPWAGPTVDDPKAIKVRQAMSLAIDRSEIVKQVLSGEAEPVGQGNFIFPGTPFYDQAWKAPSPDPEKARAMLKEAGYQDGFDIEMRLYTQTGRPFLVDVGKAVGSYWEKIGIKVKYRPIEYAAHRTDVLNTRQTTRVAGALGALYYPEPVLAWKIMFYSKGSMLLGFEHPKLEDAIVKISSELDAKKRLDMQKEIGQWMYDNQYTVPIAATNVLYGTSKNVGDWDRTLGYVPPANFEYVKHP